MSTILLSSVLSNIGRGVFGTIGSVIGSQVGAYVGYRFDTTFLGVQQDQRIFLNDLTSISSQTTSYGVNIPTVLGRAKLSGNIIWSKPIVTEFNKIEFLYNNEPIFFRHATFAVAVCTGVVDDIFSIYANDNILDINDPDNSYEVRIYKGDEDQKPDPTILEYEGGEGCAPAYRGLCYVVFENFPLSAYGNQIPAFSFEVISNPYLIENNTIEDNTQELRLQDYHKNITSIMLTPGHGEFIYSDKIQHKRVTKTALYSESSKINTVKISDSYDDAINNNTEYKKADFLVTVERLKKDLPNLKSVALEVSWYTNSLNFNPLAEGETGVDFNIFPAVKYKNVETYPDSWSVGDITRDMADAIVIDEELDDKPIYDGTPSDQSLIAALQLLKSEGYNVMLYLTLKVNDIDKPNIIHLTGDIDKIESFFSKYKNFVLHYADLVKSISTTENIFVDIFVIGSDLKGITSLCSYGSDAKPSQFMGVKGLVELASEVKAKLMYSPTIYTKITYAANFREYHSDGKTKFYNLDELWASEYIDYVGINAFFPITDSIQPLKGFPLQALYDGWESGEGYNYYYSDSQNYDIEFGNHGGDNFDPQNVRGEKIYYSEDDKQYAWKNIKSWWENEHTNPDGSKTLWVQSSKKILFTAYGFSSTNGTTNQPSVFAKESYDFSKLPYYSNGTVDFEAQRRAIAATIAFWNKDIVNPENAMLEYMFLYGYDVRPYPYYPNNIQWYDSPDWQYGHSIQGKIANCFLVNALNYLLLRCNINTDDNQNTVEQIPIYCTLDVNDRAIEGYVIKDQPTVKHIFSDLQAIFFFSITGTQSGITIIDLNKDGDGIGNFENKYTVGGASYRRRTDIMMPSKIEFTYINVDDGYKTTKELVDTGIFNTENTLPIYTTICMHEWQARQFVSIILKRVWAERWECKVSLNYYSYGKALYPGDFINVDLTTNNIDGKKLILQVFSVKPCDTSMLGYSITGYSYDPDAYVVVDRFPYRHSIPVESIYCGETKLEKLDIPNIDLFKSNPDMLLVIDNRSKKYKGSYVYYSVGRGDTYKFLGFYKKRLTYGYVVNDVEPYPEVDENIDAEEYYGISIERLSEFANNRIIDKQSIVNVFLESDIKESYLESICEDDFLAYKNKALIGNEIVNFMYADLKYDKELCCIKYQLNTFMRGCFGTESEIDKHVGQIDKFIMLDEAIVRIPISDDMIGLSIKVKLVSVPDFKEHSFEFVQDINNVGSKPPVYTSVLIKNSPPEGNKVISNLILEWEPQCYGNQPMKSGGNSDTNADEENYEIQIHRIQGSGKTVMVYQELLESVRRFEFSADEQMINLGEFLKDNIDSYIIELRQISDKYGIGFAETYKLSDSDIVDI